MTPGIPTDLVDKLAKRLESTPVLLSVAKALIGTGQLSAAERLVLTGVTKLRNVALVDQVRQAVAAGLDPLGDAYCSINSPEDRRDRGQTFSPGYVVEGMFAWIARQGKAVQRLVDPGAGSGRYTLAGLRKFPQATAVAVEMDPTVAIVLRANIAAAGFADRVKVVVDDFRNLKLPKVEGTTLFVGNPPYVRHHDISPEWKQWYSKTLTEYGHTGSQLAGLHLHFFLKTLALSSPGDLGCYVTAAEWLDVKYGQALRQLMTNGLGGKDVFVVDPTVQVFGDAMVSAAITCFAPGSNRKSLKFAEVSTEAQLRTLESGDAIGLAAAKAEPKWSFLVKGGRAERPVGFVELGEMFKVSRGQVTGLNRVWVEGADTPRLPKRFLVPAITDSTDITSATDQIIADAKNLKRLVCLPVELEHLTKSERASVDRFLDWARSLNADSGYVATHRSAWWSVPTKADVPAVVMTYMGRRPPAFALNMAKAQLINIAHGLYPRQAFTQEQLQRVVAWLNQHVSVEDGRVYAGGLTKFEPSEAMKILVPADLFA